MIPINKDFNSQLVVWHHLAIKNYLNGKFMKKKFALLELLVLEFTHGNHSFETLVKASFSTIENEIAPAWLAFPTARKIFYERSINLVGNLYAYLSINPHYNFTDAGGNTVYYNTNFLFSHLKLNVCPYCNENYTYFFNNNGKRNYDLDHFFSQIDYPILAVCFFNLVPSCKVCNFFKNASPDPLLSPYHNYKINDILEWGIEVKSSAYLYDETQLEIKVKRATSIHYLNRINDNIRVFQLENRYAQRKDIVMDTLKKKQLYNDDYINQLFKNFEGKLFKNVEDVKSMIFNTDMAEEDFNKRPFSKLIRDVFISKY